MSSVSLGNYCRAKRDMKSVLMITHSLMLMPVGVYFPLFYIQLDAVKRGLNEHFAFYSVGRTFIWSKQS